MVNQEWHSHFNSVNLEENDFLSSGEQDKSYSLDLLMHLQSGMREVVIMACNSLAADVSTWQCHASARGGVSRNQPLRYTQGTLLSQKC